MTGVLFFDEQGTIFFKEDPSPPLELKRQILAGTWAPNVRLPWSDTAISVDIRRNTVLVSPPYLIHDDVELALPSFTIREQEILQALADGFGYKEIGQQLHISQSTVKSYITSLKEKLNAGTIICTVARAVALGLCMPNLNQKR